MRRLLDASGAFQPTIKTLSHELLFRPFRRVGKEEIELFEQKHRDRELVAFLRDYAEAGPAWRLRVERANEALGGALDGLESTLARSSWLTGECYGLADVSWVVNANRLMQAHVELGAWPRVRDWAGRAMERPAFQRAVANYRP
jgi:glutathione S-transferase